MYVCMYVCTYVCMYVCLSVMGLRIVYFGNVLLMIPSRITMVIEVKGSEYRRQRQNGFRDIEDG